MVIASSSLELLKVACFLRMTADLVLVLIGSQAHVRLTGVYRIGLFGSRLTLEIKQKAKQYIENLTESYKTQIKILTYPGLA